MTPEERAMEIATDVYGDTGHPPGRPGDIRTPLACDIEKAIRDAVAEEREACAKVADGYRDTFYGNLIAELIRARQE